MKLLIDTHIWIWLADNPRRIDRKAARQLDVNFQEVGLSWAIAQEAGRINLPQGDPADLLIVATARVLDCALVTQDAKIIASGLVKTLSDD